jgi:hypothetical protein
LGHNEVETLKSSDETILAILYKVIHGIIMREESM